MLDKLAEFARDRLDDGERALLAALLAPGVAAAHEPEVVGFGASPWHGGSLPTHLAAEIQGRNLRIEGL